MCNLHMQCDNTSNHHITTLVSVLWLQSASNVNLSLPCCWLGPLWGRCVFGFIWGCGWLRVWVQAQVCSGDVTGDLCWGRSCFWSGRHWGSLVMALDVSLQLGLSLDVHVGIWLRSNRYSIGPWVWLCLLRHSFPKIHSLKREKTLNKRGCGFPLLCSC